MFSVADRNRLRQHILEWASEDNRVVAGAEVGSGALGKEDRWSDVDLTFGVADGIPIESVLSDWTERLIARFGAIVLFDLRSGLSLYRVYLAPGCLQVDLSFTPAHGFGAAGPQFKLLFGRAVEREHWKPQPADEMLGYAVHHAVRARISLERGRVWQAAHWIGAIREIGLSLACRRRNLPASDGRGVDELPKEVLSGFSASLIKDVEPAELRRAFTCVIKSLLDETQAAPELATRVGPSLRMLMELEPDAEHTE